MDGKKIILLLIPIWLMTGIIQTCIAEVSIVVLWLAIITIWLSSYQLYKNREMIEDILESVKEICESNGITKK